MSRGKKHNFEQVVNVLRQIEVGVATGKTTALACKELRSRSRRTIPVAQEYGGLQVN